MLGWPQIPSDAFVNSALIGYSFRYNKHSCAGPLDCYWLPPTVGPVPVGPVAWGVEGAGEDCVEGAGEGCVEGAGEGCVEGAGEGCVVCAIVGSAECCDWRLAMGADSAGRGFANDRYARPGRAWTGWTTTSLDIRVNFNPDVWSDSAQEELTPAPIMNNPKASGHAAVPNAFATAVRLHIVISPSQERIDLRLRLSSMHRRAPSTCGLNTTETEKSLPKVDMPAGSMRASGASQQASKWHKLKLRSADAS